MRGRHPAGRLLPALLLILVLTVPFAPAARAQSAIPPGAGEELPGTSQPAAGTLPDEPPLPDNAGPGPVGPSTTTSDAPSCGTPPAGNWTIAADCDITGNTIVARNLTVNNNATLRIMSGRSLNLDFTNYYLRIMPGARVIVQNGARLYTLSVGHTLLNNTDGTFGYYLKQANGPVLESYNATYAFYAASTIKVVQHLHAMRALQAGNVNLNTTTLNVCTGSTNCTDQANTVALCGGSMAVETLGFALQRMMVNSDNEDTNAVQELFGNGTPSAGRAAMNATNWNIVGASMSTALQHKFNCGNVSNNPYNTATLADLAELYEDAATNPAVLQGATWNTMRSLMLNEGNDNGLMTLINNVIDQEAALLEMASADIQSFKNLVVSARKAGNIAATHVSVAGWIQLPVNGGADNRQYVYGIFIDFATVNTAPSPGTLAPELLRSVIRQALAAW